MPAPAIHHPFDAPPPEGQSREVAPGVLWLRLPLPMVLDHVNVYALDDPDGWTLIDTGMDTPRARALWQDILAGPLAGKPVARVIVTHHHPDHIGLAGHFKAAGAEVIAPRTVWLLARMLTLDVQDRPSPEALAFEARAGVPADLLAAHAAARPFNFCDHVAPIPPGFTRIEEGDALTLAGRRWRVRLGQGHAPDHATLWSEDDDLILGGDQFLPKISANIGVYAAEPEADPLADWLASCARFLPLARPGHLVLPGHKLPFTGLAPRLRQMITGHQDALSRLLVHLETPRRTVECFAPLFARKIDAGTYAMAMAEAAAHLNCLLRRGAVSRSLGAEGAWLWRLADRA